MLDVNCPSCEKLLQVAATAVGRDSQCPACMTVFRPEDAARKKANIAPDTANSTGARIIADDGELAGLQDQSSELPFNFPVFAAPLSRNKPRRLPTGTIVCAIIIAFACGCLGSGFMARSGRRFSFAEIMHIPLAGTGCGIDALVVSVMLVHAKTTWQRGLRTLPFVCVHFFVIVAMLGAYSMHQLDVEGISIAVWLALGISIVCCPVLLIVETALTPLANLKDGFRKAAGRPKRVAARHADSRRFETFEDEEFP
jgi:hypothetical protein